MDLLKISLVFFTIENSIIVHKHDSNKSTYVSTHFVGISKNSDVIALGGCNVRTHVAEFLVNDPTAREIYLGPEFNL